MDLPTYTNIWRIEKRLYKLYDFRLPMPLPVGTFGVALGVFALWVVLLSILNAPFTFGNGWHLVLWVVPPGVITVLATRPVIEGKRLTELLISQARFLTEARVFTRLAPEYEPSEVRVAVRVWHRDPEAGPLPLPGRRRSERQVSETAAEEALAEDTTAGPLPTAAPPLRGVAEPAAPEPAVSEPVTEDEPVYTPAEASAPPLPSLPRSAPARIGARSAPQAQSPSWTRPRTRVPAAAEPDPVPADEPVRARRPERVPVAVAARPEPDHPEPVRPEAGDRAEEDLAGTAAVRSGHGGHEPPERPRRGVGRRVLNYFGFALVPETSEPSDGTGRSGAYEQHEEDERYGKDERDGRAERAERDRFDEPVYDTESEEQRDSDEWFAGLRASSGETPVGLTAKSAFSTGDTGALSREEVAEAVTGPVGTRHRAEEVMAAPEPGTAEESSAARRLRGRTQGIQVAKDLDERRSDQVRERATEEQRATTPAQRGRGRSPSAAEDAPERRTARAQGRGLPATEGPPERSRRRDRPHAAPWELEERDKKGEARGFGDLSDYAARYAAATGRPTADAGAVPWLPPSSATPEEERRGPRADRERAGTGTPDSAKATTPDTAPDTAPEDVTVRATDEPVSSGDTVADHDTASVHGSGAEHDLLPSRDTASSRDTGGPFGETSGEPQRKPALELDHGTGEQAAMPHQPNGEPENRDPEWNEHMSVLDHHLITADTPAPTRPKFADAVPSTERGGGPRGPAEWFEDGKKRHPDQPRVGDRGNPVIPAGELREESAAASVDEDTSDTEAAAGSAAHLAEGTEVPEVSETSELPEATQASGTPKASPASPASGVPKAPERVTDPKPPTQLDHGTGELVSFAEVREEPERADRNVRADADPARRRTVSDLEKAEAAALARRRAARPTADNRSPDPSDPVRPQDPSTTADSARSGRGDASSPARWSMRATGANGDPRANPSMAEPLSATSASEELWSKGAKEAGTEGTTGTTGTRESQGSADVRQQDGERQDSGQQQDGERHGDEQWDDERRHSGDFSDGVFHRVAQNARRLGQLFGQPAPGEAPQPPRHESLTEPKPELELDHGTGEQERLGDTPNGVPSQRPGQPEPKQRQEEPADGDSGGTRGWRRLAKVVTGGATPVRSDLPPSDIDRLRTPLAAPRSLVVLGCTGGAGQTVTTLMVGHTLAEHRDDLVVAVDVNPGPNGLSRRVGAQAPETLTALLANADEVGDYARMSGYTSRAGTGLEIVQTLDDPYVQTLDDRDYGQLSGLLGNFYGITLLDPAATGVARALPVADGLVLVAPANADAERAVSMTFDWLDGNGYSGLRSRSVLVVNGVSKRSLKDVDAAERVARGRCRAIVRIPWDDHLGSSYTRIDVGALRPATKRAHGALGGVLVNSLTQ